MKEKERERDNSLPKKDIRKNLFLFLNKYLEILLG